MTHEHHHEPEHEHHHHHDYASEVADYRARKDAYFKEGAASPIPVADAVLRKSRRSIPSLAMTRPRC